MPLFSFRRPARPEASRRRAAALRSRPSLEMMETKQLLSTFTVSNLNDSGAGSLRQAILQLDSDNNTAPDTISFNLQGSTISQFRIALQSQLPTISRPVTIDASNLPLFARNGVGLELDGNAAGSTAVGLEIYASNVTVRGLAIDGFASGGVLVDGSVTTGVGGGAHATLDHDYIGLNNATNAGGNGSYGIQFQNGAQYDTVSNTVVTSNAGSGVVFTGSGTEYNNLTQDFIGTDLTGNDAVDDPGVSLGNGGSGVVIQGAASDNTISSSVIANNQAQGVLITGSGTTSNVVQGDFIGTNGSGTFAMPNHAHGVLVTNDAAGNIIGGTTTAARDIISGNADNGVALSSGATGNTVEGDFIGTNAAGSSALPNGASGVFFSGANFNTIGGPSAADRNLISGNATYGVWLGGSAYDVIEGNDIGTDVSGTVAVPNGADGVFVGYGSSENTIGGVRNVISGNRGEGVQLNGSGGGSTGNYVASNYIGTTANGSSALANHDGVLVVGGASSNLVAYNVISGNTWDGLYISDNGTRFNHAYGNYIGTDTTGENAVSNGAYGVAIVNGAAFNYLGSDGENLISGNRWDGVYVACVGTEYDYIQNNDIGIDADATRAIGNGGSGVEVQAGASWDYVDSNIVSGNGQYGVAIEGSNTTEIQVNSNIIGTYSGGWLYVPNGASGILIAGSNGNDIEGNYLEYNHGWGILTQYGSGQPYANTIQNNNYYYNANGDFAAS